MKEPQIYEHERSEVDLSEEAVLRVIAEILPDTTIIERALIKGMGEGMRVTRLRYEQELEHIKH